MWEKEQIWYKELYANFYLTNYLYANNIDKIYFGKLMFTINNIPTCFLSKLKRDIYNTCLSINLNDKNIFLSKYSTHFGTNE